MIRNKPIEMLISKKKIDLEECIQASMDISKDKFGLQSHRSNSVVVYFRNGKPVCSLGWTIYGVVIMDRDPCEDFAAMVQLSILIMAELSTKEDNDMDLLRRLIGRDIFEEAKEEEILSMEEEFIQRMPSFFLSEEEEIIDEDSDDWEWI